MSRISDARRDTSAVRHPYATEGEQMNQNQQFAPGAEVQPQQTAPAAAQQYQQPYPPAAPTPQEPKSRAAMGIVSLVLGIIALLTSFVPIINNFAALLAVIGLIFGIIGVVITVKNRCGGKGLSIAGLILNIVAFIVVLASQAVYSAAIDEALSTNSPSQVVATDGAEASSSDQTTDQSFEDLALGTAVQLNNGMTVSVDAVQPGLTNYNGNEITGITVTYTNNGTSSESFNVYDWKGQDAQGAQRSTAYFADGTDELHSGSLAPGGTVTGNIYFEGALAKVVYEQMISFDDETVSWLAA